MNQKIETCWPQWLEEEIQIERETLERQAAAEKETESEEGPQ